MIPPGIHLIIWSTSDSSTAIRHGLLYDFQPRRTLVLKYNSVDDQVHPSLAEESGLPLPSDISRDQLRSLDAELASFPFQRIAGWRDLVGPLSSEDVHRVTRTGLVDSLMESPTDREVAQTTAGSPPTNDDEPTLSFPPFDVKRSWRAGAVGEEVTRFAKDKSWLWCDVVSRQYGGGESCHPPPPRSVSYHDQVSDPTDSTP
jgi:A1 cistron-splicing factor AAR2